MAGLQSVHAQRNTDRKHPVDRRANCGTRLSPEAANPADQARMARSCARRGGAGAAPELNRSANVRLSDRAIVDSVSKFDGREEFLAGFEVRAEYAQHP